MNTIWEILSSIWANLTFFRIVESWAQGVRFRRGKPEPKPLPAGIWFHWPTVDRIEVVPVKERFIDLPVQSATTADGVEVTFSANIGYQIVDGVLAVCEVHDLEDAMSRIAMGHLHCRIHDCALAELTGKLSHLEKSLEGTLTTRVKKWGVLIVDVGITDMVKTGWTVGQLRIFGETP